jgi:hypothetical protein
MLINSSNKNKKYKLGLSIVPISIETFQYVILQSNPEMQFIIRMNLKAGFK